jgi:cell wall-associated NlpC family hydrolase
MAVFAYSPAVEVYIKSLSKNQIYDVSADQVRGQAILRTNAPHQMSITLMNKNRRYDALFAPNDLFVIYMKRIRRLMIMSGYLDSVPWYSTWERSVQIFGTCTNKRLLQKRWDPGTLATMNLMASEGNSASQLAVDGGMQAKAISLITQVGGWPENTIHIAGLPSTWAQKIQNLYSAASPVLLGNIWNNTGGTVSTSANNSPMVGSTYTAQSLPSGLTSSQQTFFSLPNAATGLAVVPYSGSPDICEPKTKYYCQMNWGYMQPSGKSLRKQIRAWLAGQPPPGSGPVMIYSPTTGKTVLCEPVGDGPGRYNPNNQKIGLSPEALKTLGITTAMINQKALVHVAWTDQTLNANHYPPGPWPVVETIKKVKGKTTITITQAPSTMNTPATSNPYSANTPATQSTAQGQQVVTFARAQIGKPYVFGATGPNSWDCSGLAVGAWASVGLQWDSSSRSTEQQWANPKIHKFNDTTSLQLGDLVYYSVPGDHQDPPNHMGIYSGETTTGQQMTVQAMDSKLGIHEVPMVQSGITIMGYGRPTGYPGFKGTPTSVVPGSGSSGTASPSSSLTASADTSFGGIAQGVPSNTSFINYWEWFGQAPTVQSNILTGIRGLLNDQPLLPFVNTVLNASMRSWCSAPNGDFIAWFPDYFGAYGTAATLSIEDVELMDFSIAWSDQTLVTHQYVASSWVSQIFGSSPGGAPTIANLATTDGVVTLEMGNLSNNILQTVLNLKSGDASGFGDPQKILNRFGARSNFQEIGVIMSQEAQFWYALFLFQLNWASMFTASMPTTFMPEAFPGMLARLSDGFQAYINQVQHGWDFTDGGPGFTTQLAIMAPSDWKNGGLFGLPAGGTKAVV